MSEKRAKQIHQLAKKYRSIVQSYWTKKQLKKVVGDWLKK